MRIPFLIKKEKNQSNSKFRLIVGLGNVGLEYSQTRHNVGFLFLDKISKEDFREESKFKSEVSKLGSTYLSKPSTYMNNSGDAVQLIKQFYKIENNEILVVYDDLDLQTGAYKFQQKGPKVHNGVNSVAQNIGEGFWHLRIGIDSRTPEQRIHYSGKDYVLSKISDEDRAKIFETFDNILSEQEIV